MGEIPIFTSKAHVFVIDPVTKKSWVPSSKALVQVNFFLDSSRNTYRIISVDGSKAIINSTVAPEMSFTKTSGKFGQWADLQAGVVYGLGFSTDSQLSEFSEQFQAICELSKNIRSENKMKTTNEVISPCSFNSHIEDCAKDVSMIQFSSNVNNHARSQDNTLSTTSNGKSLQNKATKGESDALKMSNDKLAASLKEAREDANDRLEKLNDCREECEKKDAKINELEAEKKKLHQTVKDLMQRNEGLQRKNKEISQECSLLQQRIEVLSVVEAQHDQCAERIKTCMERSQQAEEDRKMLEDHLEEASLQRRTDAVEVRKCCAEIVSHLAIITEATQKLQTAI